MPPKILIVDDEAPHRQMLQAVMSAEGYEIQEAEDGQTAIAGVANQFYDLILMDIQLPDFDGYEATRRIKANPALSAIPIFAVTSYALSGDDVKAYEAGCDAYVSKPFSPRALLAKIREFIS